MTRSASAVQARSATWAAYAACTWALVFAAQSFYWAAGGTIGLNTLGPTIQALAQARDPVLVGLVWVTGGVKIIGALFALALVQQWGRIFPRWMLLAGAWSAGVGMIGYGGLGLVLDGLRAMGAINNPGGWAAVRGHLLLWDPWWLLGGILFSAAAWFRQHRVCST